MQSADLPENRGRSMPAQMAAFPAVLGVFSQRKSLSVSLRAQYKEMVVGIVKRAVVTVNLEARIPYPAPNHLRRYVSVSDFPMMLGIQITVGGAAKLDQPAPDPKFRHGQLH